jgi:hypothetical protein
MPLVGFEHAIQASERPQTHALDRAATGIGAISDAHLQIQAFELTVLVLRSCAVEVCSSSMPFWDVKHLWFFFCFVWFTLEDRTDRPSQNVSKQLTTKTAETNTIKYVLLL